LLKMPSAQPGRYDARVLKGGGCLISLEAVPYARSLLLAKRALDIAGAAAGLVLCAAAYLLYARRIRRESRGTVLFRQNRVGRNGRLFRLWKFRTMYPDAEKRLRDLMPYNEMRGCVFKMRNDPRVTPLGAKLRRRYIDELPQFWNVLKGEMSLVGTRPPTPDEVARYQPHHRRRLSMRPGITGLWQLYGGAVNDFEEIVRLDCRYIDNWSLWLDFRILIWTLLKVIRATGW
jgi:lipopolysaccharide/colanic/teichoic acid biosynthesis glycosyltransferase